MTREEFISGFVERTGSGARAGRNGMFLGGRWFALPCACGQDGCEGWAMVMAEMVHDHLCRDAPEPLRQTYLDAVGGWF